MYNNAHTGVTVRSGYSWRIHTFEVPVIPQLKFGKPGRNHLFVGLGGYIASNISGSISPSDVNGGVLKIGSGDRDDIKSMDIGIALELGLQLKSDFFFQFKSQGGISNLRPQATAYASAIRTSSYSLEVGYFFARTVKHRYTGKSNGKLPQVMD